MDTDQTLFVRDTDIIGKVKVWPERQGNRFRPRGDGDNSGLLNMGTRCVYGR